MIIKKKGKLSKSLIIIVVLLSLVGCSTIRFDTNEIIKAPRISAEYEQLKNLIEKKEGREISLVLPSTLTDPENSAIKVKDDLAIVSFSFVEEVYGYVSILKKENDQWRLVDTLKKPLHVVDCMNLVDFNNNGDIKVIVSWLNNGSRKSAISVYDTGGDLIDEISSDDGFLCKNFTLCDINSDGKLEMVAFFSPLTNRNNFAGVYSFNKKFDLISSCDIRDFIKYFAITVGRIDDNHMGIFLDGDYYDSKEYFCTDAVFWNNGKLEHASNNFFDASLRFVNEKSKDVDGDGIIEVPNIGELYDFAKYGNKDLGVSVIWKKWSIQNDRSTVLVKNKSYIYNDYARYAIMMPDRWFDSDGNSAVISLIDNNEKNMIFYVRQSNAQLFEIKIFSKDEWKEVDKSVYSEIALNEKNKQNNKNENLVYAVKYLSDSELKITLDELKSRFVFL